jgi:hypothetical protein
VLLMRRPRKIQIFVTIMLSVTWIVSVILSLPPISTQLNCIAILIYCSAGVAIIIFSTYFLHYIDEDYFRSLRTAAPLGAVFVAIVALLGYLISAEREARRPFLEKQLENCVRLAEAAGKLQTPDGGNVNLLKFNLAEFEEAWNRLTIFSDEALEKVHRRFMEPVNQVYENIHNNALCVARMCRVMVHASWSVIPHLVREDVSRECICRKMAP